MSQKALKITGWDLTIVLGLLFTVSAYMKVIQNKDTLAQSSSIGLDVTTYLYLGILEITCLVLFLFQRTGVIGTILLAAYLSGAIATNLQHQQPILIPVIVQVLLWITAFIRFPELTHRLLNLKNN